MAAERRVPWDWSSHEGKGSILWLTGCHRQAKGERRQNLQPCCSTPLSCTEAAEGFPSIGSEKGADKVMCLSREGKSGSGFQVLNPWVCWCNSQHTLLGWREKQAFHFFGCLPPVWDQTLWPLAKLRIYLIAALNCTSLQPAPGAAQLPGCARTQICLPASLSSPKPRWWEVGRAGPPHAVPGPAQHGLGSTRPLLQNRLLSLK